MSDQAANAGRPALFLDRDGVVNIDGGYVHKIADLIFVDGIFELARCATAAEMPLVVVTNQAGIGKGLYSEADYQVLTRFIVDRFAAAGAPLSRVYHCPFHPEKGIGAYRQQSSWRKPAPGMILQAARDLQLDLSRSILVGDRASDIEAAQRAGVGCKVLFSHADSIVDPGPLTSPPDHSLENHDQVQAVLMAQVGQS